MRGGCERGGTYRRVDAASEWIRECGGSVKGAGEGQGKADIYAGRETKGQSARGVRGGGRRKTVKERERETAQANGGGRG